MSSSPSTTDCPLRRAERRFLATCAAAAACVGAAIWVSLATPRGPAAAEPPAAAARSPARAPEVTPFAAAAFDAVLWVEPPPAPTLPTPPASAAPPPPPLPPLRLALVAVVRADHGLAAAIYDADADRLVLVPAGGAVGRARVAAVDAGGVTLDVDGRERRLVLRAEDGS